MASMFLKPMFVGSGWKSNKRKENGEDSVEVLTNLDRDCCWIIAKAIKEMWKSLISFVTV